MIRDKKQRVEEERLNHVYEISRLQEELESIRVSKKSLQDQFVIQSRLAHDSYSKLRSHHDTLMKDFESLEDCNKNLKTECGHYEYELAQSRTAHALETSKLAETIAAMCESRAAEKSMFTDKLSGCETQHEQELILLRSDISSKDALVSTLRLELSRVCLEAEKHESELTLSIPLASSSFLLLQ